MAFINKAHEMNVKSELDLFSTLPTQTAIESGSLQSYRPITSISNNGPIEFVVSGCSNDEYLDLARVYLHLQVRLKVPVPAATAAVPRPVAPKVGPVNNWLHSMFSQVDIFLNQKCITPPNNCYHYRAIIENILNYSSNSKQSHLTTGLFYNDTAGEMDSIEANTGFTARYNHTKSGEIVELMGPLHCDLFNVDKYLLGGVEMTVKLQRAKDGFHLMGVDNSNADFEIVDAELFVRKVRINPSVVLAHNRTLEISPARYDITRIDIKTISMGQDIVSKTIDNLYLGNLPKRCIIGFVDTAAYNGRITLNPYNFKNYDLSFLCCYLDSSPIPTKPFVCDFGKKQYVRAYNSLFEGCNIDHADIGNGISREDYAGGYMLIAIDLTPDHESSKPHLSVPKTGSLRIELKFSKPLPEGVTAIIYSEFASMIEIDKNRNVVTDYSS